MRPSPPDENDDGPLSEDVLISTPEGVQPDGAGVARQVDQLPRRRRNQVYIAAIVLGLANFLVYTLTYAALGGDAHNGSRRVVTAADGGTEVVYYVRGHFIHSLSGHERVVGRGAWIYSYLHSISVPLTSGALIISMLLLARPHIFATMRGGWISGQTFVVALGTIVLLVTISIALLLIWSFVEELTGV